MEKQKNNYKVTTNRFVAFLDIMGFKDMVAREDHEEIYRKLQLISKIKDTLTDENENRGIRIVMFSDSIIIYSNDDSIECFHNFLIRVNIAFSTIIHRQIPIKGAVAYGKLSVNNSGLIFFGQPQIDAYLLQEQEVYYYGMVCHNSIEQYINKHQQELEKYQTLSLQNNKGKTIWEFLLETQTPLKSGEIQHLNMNWFIGSFSSNIINLQESRDIEAVNEHFSKIEQQIKQLYYNVSGRPRRYIDNTLNMLNKSKEQYLKQQFPKYEKSEK